MHEPLLARAALPAPVVCAGMLLREYSIGHELLLICNGSTFWTANAPGLSDLVAAVLVCSQSWLENQRMHCDPLLRFKMWLWRRRIRGLNLPAEIEKFTTYRAEGSLELPVQEILRSGRSEPPRMPGAPFLLRLQQWLMLTFRLSDSAAWDYPLGLAVMRWETFWEQERGLDVYNALDAQADQYAAEQDALALQAKEMPCRA